jgi:predicted AAA+ superfamily ATPase
MNDKLEHLLTRAEQLIGRIEAALPQPLGEPDWSASIAFRYRKRSNGHGPPGAGAPRGHDPLDDLQEIDIQKEKIQRNTRSSWTARAPTTCC